MQRKDRQVQIITITLLLAIVACSAIPASYSQSAMAVDNIAISVTNPTPVVFTGETVTAILTSGGLPPVPGVSVIMKVTYPDSTVYTSSPATTDGAGKVTFPFTVSKIAGTNTITIIAGTVQNSLSIVASADVPASLKFMPLGNVLNVAGENVLPSNGLKALNVVAILKDQYGNPVGNTNITVYDPSGTPSIITTDTTGTVGPFPLGPSVVQKSETLLALCGSLTDSFTMNFVPCELSASVSDSMVTAGENVTATASMRINGSYYQNVLMAFRLYYVPGTIVDESFVSSNSSGISSRIERTSDTAGKNYIIVGVDELGIHRTLTVDGINGTPATIDVVAIPVGNVNQSSSDPISGKKVYADGSSYYDVIATLSDAKGNPIGGVNISFVDDMGNTWQKVTDEETGKAWIASYPSNEVHGMELQIFAEDYCNKVVTLNYDIGSPVKIFVRANPNVVASSDVDDTGLATDPHSTTVSAVVMDQWYHPVPNRDVALSVLVGNGAIETPASGMTDSSGAFISTFTLNHDTPDSARVPDGKLYDTAVVNAISHTSDGQQINSTVGIIYTNDSFLSVEANINPMNASLGQKIDVSVNITGIGWMVQPRSSDIFLVMDKSPSMKWYADMEQDSDFKTYIGTIEDGVARGNIPVGTSESNAGDWYKIGSYNLNKSNVSKFDIMIGWNWLNVGAGDNDKNPKYTYYLMKIKKNGSSSTFATATYGKTETIWVVDNAATYSGLTNGWYDIYAYYHAGTGVGASPPSEFRLSVETKNQRLPSAKTALKEFVNNVAEDDRVGFVPYDQAASLGSPLTPMTPISSKTDLKNIIDSVSYGSGTNTYLGMQKAIDQFDLYSNPDCHKYMILVTDGYSYDPPQDRVKANIAKSKGIIIYTVGIGACDEDGLNYIATTTGGEYYHASNSSDLTEQFKNIAKYIHKTVAEDSQITMIGDQTTVDTMLVNNTEYVPLSGKVKPNVDATETQVDPIITIQPEGYNLTWYPGEITIGQTWGLKYQLNVSYMDPNNSTITPIKNDSFIWFTRDGQTFKINLPETSIHVNNNTSINPAGDRIMVTITNPPSGNITSDIIDIKWNVFYNATEWYNETISYSLEGGTFKVIEPFWPGSNVTQNYAYPWDISDKNKYPPGNYTIKVEAFERTGPYLYRNSSTVDIYRVDTRGNIILS